MSRTKTTSLFSLLILTTVATTDAFAGGCGGGGGRSSGRFAIAYTRSAPHMRSHAPAPHYRQPTHHRAPVYHQPVVAAPAPIVQGTIVQQPQAIPAGQSALSALAALDTAPQPISAIPQFGPAASPTTVAYVGSWSATLPGDNRVDLRLEANGAFRWVASSRGKVSSFEGTFTVVGGRLVLVRSGDNQQLAGAWTADANGGFRFQLDGSGEAGLLFARG